MKQHPLARFLGTTYAHVQHGLDQLIEWSVSKLKDVDARPKKEVPPTKGNPAVHVTMKVVRGALGFIGTGFETYFTKYRELKTGEHERMKKEKPPKNV